jgi:hypothetical protein
LFPGAGFLERQNGIIGSGYESGRANRIVAKTIHEMSGHPEPKLFSDEEFFGVNESPVKINWKNIRSTQQNLFT